MTIAEKYAAACKAMGGNPLDPGFDLAQSILRLKADARSYFLKGHRVDEMKSRIELAGRILAGLPTAAMGGPDDPMIMLAGTPQEPT